MRRVRKPIEMFCIHEFSNGMIALLMWPENVRALVPEMRRLNIFDHESLEGIQDTCTERIGDRDEWEQEQAA